MSHRKPVGRHVTYPARKVPVLKARAFVDFVSETVAG